MVKKRKRKSGINWKTCAACGGPYGRVSGFVICENCGHKPDFDGGYRQNFRTGQVGPLPTADAQSKAPPMIRRGRYSFKKEIE